MAPILTIVVSTYNRSDWLRSCLASLEPQCQDDSVEVLVVDNNSSDNTAGVVQEFSDRSPNVKYIFEAMQGLSHARNRGIKEALGRIVAYIDDDGRAHPDWVSAIIRFFDMTPDASGVGGPYSAFSSVPIPPWFPKEYGSKSLGTTTRKLQSGEWISGTNMAFPKSALVEIGGFDSAIGMNGDKVSYGEETNLVKRMRERGMQIYYCAEMGVDHAILPYKLKLTWLLRSNYCNGYDGVATFNYKGGAVLYLPRLLWSMARACSLFLLSRERYLKTRIYRSMAQLCWDVGFFAKLVEL
jgi:glycosyltransferase involved in cell wall biosynthesis